MVVRAALLVASACYAGYEAFQFVRAVNRFTKDREERYEARAKMKLEKLELELGKIYERQREMDQTFEKLCASLNEKIKK